MAHRLWDVVILGAGPAGAMAAYELAKHNLHVLLIDQSAFPRQKVCGGCLSHRALGELESAGLGDLTYRLGAKPVHGVCIVSANRSARIQIPQGASLSRERFDFALVEEARSKGAVFLSSTKGVMAGAGPDFARVRIAQNKKESEVHARIALVSDGLLGSSLGDFPEGRAVVSTHSLIGVSTSLDEKTCFGEEGVITMACGQGGYVGIARREDNRLEIAAAIRPRFLKFAGTPGKCVEAILGEAGLKLPGGFSNVHWQGAPSFPRARKVLAGKRFFVLGDASGFVEPFTGEGIYWALVQAKALVSLLRSRGFAWNDELPSQWQKVHHALLGRRMKACKIITTMLRMPALCRLAVEMTHRAPWLVSSIVRYVHGSDS